MVRDLIKHILALRGTVCQIVPSKSLFEIIAHTDWQPAGQMIHHLVVSAPGAAWLWEINDEVQS